ncbi:MAG: hypothetical protein ABIT16_03790 [Croceibacterium sp.]
MRRIATAIVAVVLVTGAAQVQAQGHGNGGGNGKNGGGGMQAASHGNGNDKHGNAGGAMQAAAHGNGNGNAMRASAPAKKEAHGNGNAVTARSNGNGNGNSDHRTVQRVKDDRGHGNDSHTVVVDRRVAVSNRDARDGDWNHFRTAERGLIDGCPPGLAKKHNGCLPPGQVRNDRRTFSSNQANWWGLRNVSDGRYFYNDGYLYRLGSGGGIASYIPLLGGALSIGNAWPSYYQPVSLPNYYQDYYNLGPQDSYRYANNVIYRVDPQTSAITSIAALLTGDDFSIGQRMPSGYDVYNVPYNYRDQYVDSPASQYRYSDGYVYQVDPTTRLIQAAIQLLT